MLVLPVAEPAPFPGQIQVLPQLIQRDVGVGDRVQARGAVAVAVARGDQVVVQLHGAVEQVFADAVAVFARELAHLRCEPRQQLPCAGV